MAPFNPPVQNKDPKEYDRESRGPVDVPNNINPRGQEANQILPRGVEQGDRSAEYMGKSMAAATEAEASQSKGFGDLFAGIVSAGNFLMQGVDAVLKKKIENEVYSMANNEREFYTGDLEKLRGFTPEQRNFLNANASADALSGGGGDDVLSGGQGDDDDDLPTELGSLQGQLSTIQGGLTAGKISPIYYYGRLTAMAKDLRAKYPGHRQYIDQQFASVTGVNPANSYIGALMTDINRNMALAARTPNKSDYNKAVTFVQQRSGYQDAPQVMANIQSGNTGGLPPLVYAMQWGHQRDRAKADFELNNLRRNDAEGGSKERVRIATEQANGLVTGEVRNAIHNIMTSEGYTPAKLLDQMSRADQGLVTDEENQRMLNTLVRVRQRIVSEVDRLGSTTTEGAKTSLKQDLGDKWNGIITSNMFLLDDAIKNFSDKKYGPAYANANSILAMTADDTRKFYDNTGDLGKMGRFVNVVKGVAGETMYKDLYVESIKKGKDMGSGIADYWRYLTMEQMGQPDKATNGGRVRTVKELIEESTRKIKATGQEVPPAFNEAIIKNVTMITNPKMNDEAKLNLVYSAFDRRGWGVLERLNDDFRDPQTGQIVPGKWMTYKALTTPEMQKEIIRLGEKDPTVVTNYNNWMDMTFKNLFGEKIADLNQYQSRADAHFRIGWDTDKKEWRVRDFTNPRDPRLQGPGGAALANVRKTEIDGIQAKLDNINIGLKGIQAFAEANKFDVETYMLDKLQQAGWEPSTQVQGLPSELVSSLLTAKSAELLKQEKLKRARQEWISGGKNGDRPE